MKVIAITRIGLVARRQAAAAAATGASDDGGDSDGGSRGIRSTIRSACRLVTRFDPMRSGDDANPQASCDNDLIPKMKVYHEAISGRVGGELGWMVQHHHRLRSLLGSPTAAHPSHDVL